MTGTLERVRDLCREAARQLEAASPAAAEPLADQALALARAGLGPTHYALAEALCTSGWVAEALGLRERARSLFREAHQLAAPLGAHDPEHAGSVLAKVADWLHRAGCPGEAQAVRGELLQLWAAHLGPDHPRYLVLKASLEPGLGVGQGPAQAGSKP